MSCTLFLGVVVIWACAAVVLSTFGRLATIVSSPAERTHSHIIKAGSLLQVTQRWERTLPAHSVVSLLVLTKLCSVHAVPHSTHLMHQIQCLTYPQHPALKELEMNVGLLGT